MKKTYVYSNDVDSQTLEQFKSCVNQKYVQSAALMPDAHLGYAAPIGAVLQTKGFVVPAWVGFDIGCGVCALKLSASLNEIKKNAKKIHSSVSKKVPMGMGQKNSKKNISLDSLEKLSKLIEKYRKEPNNKSLFNFFKQAAEQHLGTLGGGNHFVELATSGKDVWLVIHSGSRGIGHRIATYYMQEAAKIAGKSEIEETNALSADSDLGKEYIAAQNICLEYALLNRMEMASKIVETISKVLGKKIKYSLWTNKNHNHVILERGLFVHRKGATPANKGERGVIPGNMRDGSVLVEGKGNKDFLYSSSHGAGRLMSRRDAVQNISLEQFKYSMSDIVATVSEATLNEAPQAYKSLSLVMQAQKKSVKIVKEIKPIINWKGVEQRYRD